MYFYNLDTRILVYTWNSYCPCVTCDNIVYHHTEYKLWDKSPETCLTIQCTPNLDNAFCCYYTVFHCSKQWLKTRNAHKLHIKVKFEMLRMIYKLTITKHQKVTRSFSVKSVRKNKKQLLQEECMSQQCNPGAQDLESHHRTLISAIHRIGLMLCNTVPHASGNFTLLLLPSTTDA